MTGTDLIKEIQLWQSRLGLTEWEITAEVISTDDLPYEAVASCNAQEQSHRATISVADQFLSGDIGQEYSLEFVVAHELLHVLFRDQEVCFEHVVGNLGTMGGGGFRAWWVVAEEQALNRLTKILISAYDT